MGFFRENILKFIIIFVIVIVMTILFTFLFTGGKKPKTYSDMEANMKTAAIKYANSNTAMLPKDDTRVLKINLDTLINNKYLKEYTALENKDTICTGYVNVLKKDDSYSYKPYLKCGNYYETKTISRYILENEQIVTTETGLYKYGDTYVYRGENPNNYIMLSDKLFRIIEITKDNQLKIIANDKTVEEFIWDDRYNSEKEYNYGINDYSKSRLKDSLASFYKSEYFTNSDREKIVKHDFCVGKRSISDGSMDGSSECSILEKDQYVGLLQVNEYARASISNKCTSALNLECQNYNYLEGEGKNIRTLNGVKDNTYQIYYLSYGSLSTTYASNSFSIYPVVYLGEDTIYQSGNGTSTKPYIVR